MEWDNNNSSLILRPKKKKKVQIFVCHVICFICYKFHQTDVYVMTFNKKKN